MASIGPVIDGLLFELLHEALDGCVLAPGTPSLKNLKKNRGQKKDEGKGGMSAVFRMSVYVSCFLFFSSKSEIF